jgi:hypothetical protein
MTQDPNSPMGRRYNLLCVPKDGVVINELPEKGKLEGSDTDVKIEIHQLLKEINCN